jgi:hypothetical protein
MDRYEQFEAGDGCVYFFDLEKGRYQKLCDIVDTQDMPKNARDYFKTKREQYKVFIDTII